MGLENEKQAQTPIARDKRQETVWDVTRLLGNTAWHQFDSAHFCISVLI